MERWPHMRFWRRWIFYGWAFLLFSGLIFIGTYALPSRHNPLKPLDLDQPIGLATKLKLAGLRGAPERCYALLTDAGQTVTRVPDRTPGARCGWRDALRLSGSLIAYNRPVTATCPVAAALFIWERDVVQPAAEKAFGEAISVRRIDHFGTYACRRIRGSRSRRYSQHARANAIDIAGFELSDGSYVSVLKDWPGAGSKARFLRTVRDGACRAFTTVLSPDYNRAHRNHFHLDMGGFSTCR